MLILAYFFTKNELYGQNDHSIPKPLLCLKLLQNFRKKIMNHFLDNYKSLQKKAKKGQKEAKNADFRLFLTFFFIIFGPCLLILNQNKISKFQNLFLKI